MSSAGKSDKLLSVTIETTQGTWDTEFEKTEKVQSVIQATTHHFEFVPDGRYEFRLDRNPNEVLQPERPLVSYGIIDGDVLVFTDLGVAV
jgi:hypothetical protein